MSRGSAANTVKTAEARLRFNIDLFIQLLQVLVDYIVSRYLRRFSIARVIIAVEKIKLWCCHGYDEHS